MTRTIRIDDEIYSWLQKQAQPFEDSPNSVLRRIAGLDPSRNVTAKKSTKAENQDENLPLSSERSSQPNALKKTGLHRPINLTGRQLNDEWNVGAQHALFHRDGCWYNNLIRFPGALFDPDGYIVFKTEEEYRNCPQVQIGQETNIPQGISAITGYVRVVS